MGDVSKPNSNGPGRRDIPAPGGVWTQQSLAAGDDTLAAIIRNSPIAIMALDPNQRVMMCNPAAERMFGWPADEIIGRPYSLIPKEQRRQFSRLWAELKAGKIVADREVQRRRRDGTLLDVSLSVAFLRDARGEVCGFLGMMVDITERKKAHAEREQAYSLLRAALESTEDGILAVDLDGAATTFNERFVKMWRVPAAAASQPNPLIFEHALALIQNPESFLGQRAELLRHPDRESFDVLHTKDNRILERYSRPQMVGGEPVGRVFCYRDVTQRVRAEEQIRQLNRELEERVRERTAALAQANSELRRKMRELRALNGMAATISTSLDLPEQLNALAEHFSRDLQVPAGMFFVGDTTSDVSGDEQSNLRMQCCWGVPEDRLSALSAGPETARFLAQSLQKRRVVRARLATANQENGAAVRNAEEVDFGAPTVVPVLTNSRVEALLMLWNRSSRPFSDYEIRLFKSLSKQVVLAIQNARLFSELRVNHERLQALSLHAVDVQERERRHIARELHDEIGQMLTGVKLSLEMLRREPKAAEERLDHAQDLINDLMARVRELSLELRPAMLDDLGLVPALLWLFDSYSRQTGVRVAFEHTSEGERYAHRVETAAYRIVQEALTNVARHAGCSDAWVRLSTANGLLRVQIDDRGRGFDAAGAMSAVRTAGLPGMKERATLLGGQLSVSTAPGEGTRILALLPLSDTGGPIGDTDVRAEPEEDAGRPQPAPHAPRVRKSTKWRV